MRIYRPSITLLLGGARRTYRAHIYIGEMRLLFRNQ